ncbi:Membrane frizzled-related protein Membrane-type frizzled-related protein [Channa argus]|uniref:Membrane frizzled-related protein Membrane-type frizzled-related protein n=1 Tax=Channa argus TaxID=215402 RepID=A0A6G1PRX1_CHAAH|nr:Membrane frizzled-related protein Membrane-type frizzled-related protein [Channa argus]
MSNLNNVSVYSDSSDIYKNVFCNPTFELEEEREEIVEGFRTSLSTSEPIKPPAAGLGWGLLRVLVMRLRGPGCGWGVFIVSVAALLLLAAVGLALALILTRCGGALTDSEGSFSSPNHPGSYPPNSQCVWVIQVPPNFSVQIHISSLTVEGPFPCLFDWLEVQEQIEQSSVVTRYCGNVAPPTINTNSSTVWVTFWSDGSIAGNGFMAQYRAVLPEHKSCSREEFMCDSGRCLLPVSVCDGYPNCQDQTDEKNCSHKDNKCGGQKTGPYGYLSSPNHPKPYPHQQGHIITLSFRNFSLETQDVCEFDYVEVHDSEDTGTGRVLGRFCGTTLPPDLTSTGSYMTVMFVADEGVADSGFNATYQAVSLLDRTCGPNQFACNTGECLQPQWLCDGWNDCPDGADEQSCGNSTYPTFTSSCELIEVEMCQGLSYNLTSFPNIWLSIADQREAATLLKQYRVETTFIST